MGVVWTKAFKISRTAGATHKLSTFKRAGENKNQSLQMVVVYSTTTHRGLVILVGDRGGVGKVAVGVQGHCHRVAVRVFVSKFSQESVIFGA